MNVNVSGPFGAGKGYAAVTQNMETVKKYFRVDHHDIGFIKFIIEAYDGLAVMTTVDRGRGVVELNIAPGCEAEIDLILKDLKKDLLIEPVNF
jgi:hypothetical protein